MTCVDLKGADLKGALKEVWTEDAFKRAFTTDMDSLLMDHRRDMQRQVYQNQVRFTGDPNIPGGQMYGIHVDMSAAAVRARKQRQDQMMYQLQLAKRHGKPSYRQRQKNARAARND